MVDGAPTPPAAPSLWRNHAFWLLSVGQGVSRLGDGLYTAVLAWLAWTLTFDPGAVGVVALAANLPAFFGTLIGSSFADRYDRRRLMIGCDIARGMLMAPLPWLLDAGWLNFWGLVGFAALIASAGAPFAPARNAIVPSVVAADQLLAANGFLQVSFRSAYFVGPLLLGPLAAVVTLNGILLVNAATFVVSALSLALMRVRRQPLSAERVGVWRDLAAGWRELRAAPDVLLVIATFVAALAIVSGGLITALPILVDTRLHAGSTEYGLLLGLAGVAEVVGAMLLTRWRFSHLAAAATLVWIPLGLARAPLGYVDSLWLAAVLLVGTGFLSAITDIPLIALVQSKIPDRHLAKVLGLWEAGIMAAISISPPMTGLVIAAYGLELGILAPGIGLVLLGAIAYMWLRRLK